LLWKDGISSLSELTAKFKVGIMFTFVVAPLQDEGKIKLEEVLGSKAHLNDVSQVFEMILAYWVLLERKFTGFVEMLLHVRVPVQQSA
jgi:hypothetical protein